MNKHNKRKLKETIPNSVKPLELYTERFGSQFKAILRLSNGEEREAIADTAPEAQRLVMAGMDLDWSFGVYA